MEIHLLLEGEQVGPLSEAQVRQYMDQGLVTAEDLASHAGMDDWMPLERVLARIPGITPDPQIPKLQTTETTESIEAIEANESNFLITNDTGATGSPPETTATENLSSLTSSQRTKKKLGKIVIQPILPLETAPAQKKKSGKTAITLEPLRSTMSLPPVTGHQPRKAAGRTGKVSLRIPPPTAPEADLFAPDPEPNLEPAPVLSKVTPEIAPAPAVIEPELVAEPVTPDPTLATPLEIVPEATPVIATEVTEPPAPATPSTAPQKLPDPAPVFSVLPKDSPFVPPAIRSINKPPLRRPGKSRFPYAGVAIAAFIIAVIITCICLFAWRGGTAPTPNPFRPQTSTAPPVHVPIAAAGAATPTAAELGDQGMKLQSSGDLDGAIRVYNQALALDPQAVEVLYRRGLAHQAKQDLPDAITDYTQVLALNPRRANAFSNRGFIRQAQLDLDGALADYAQALAITPNQPVVYNNIGLIKVKKGDLDGAIAAYDRAIDADPQMAFALYNRGVAKNTEGNVDGAIADFTQALALNSKIAVAYRDRGQARQSKGDATGAMADYDQALSLDPTLTDAFFNRGVIKAQRGDTDGAIDDQNHAIMLDSTYAQAYHHRGLAWMSKGRLDNALADLKKFCELGPRDPATDAARLHVWVLAMETNANGDADSELSTALLNDWNSTPEDLTSKIANFLLGHMSEADFIANAAAPDPARASGQYCRVYYFAGMKRLLNGETPAANSLFQKCVATGQKDLPEYGYAQAELQALNPGKPAAGD